MAGTASAICKAMSALTDIDTSMLSSSQEGASLQPNESNDYSRTEKKLTTDDLLRLFDPHSTLTKVQRLSTSH